MVVKYSKLYKELTLFNFMLKTYKLERPIDTMVVKEEQIPLIVKQKRTLDYILNPNRGEEFIYGDPGLYLEGGPKEFKERILWLCLRGLRDGLLQIAEIYRVTDPLKIASIDGADYEEKAFDHSKGRNIKTGVKLDPIQKCVKKRLLEDSLARKYLTWNNSLSIFEANCENIAFSISVHYANLVKQEELKRQHII